MKFSKVLLLIIFANATFNTSATEPVLASQAQNIMAQWFSIDPKHNVQMRKTLLQKDKHGERFLLSFTSDDQQIVNGMLAMPVLQNNPIKLALMLHPMGRDQNIWWSEDNVLLGGALTNRLRQQGYAVLTLDARRHGKRVVDDIGLGELLKRAHSDNHRLYLDMIVGTVRDYRLALNWAKAELGLEKLQVMVVGYSMGAQMSLLLASYEADIKQVLAMVPPYVEQANSPVAPRHHVGRIKEAKVMLFTAKRDPYSSQQQNQYVFDNIGSTNKAIKWFDSGHVLPKNYLAQALSFIAGLSSVKH